MSPQSGIPYEKRQPSPELRSFLDPLKPGAYFDCGRARLYGIDEVLEQEAERRGRPVGPDHFQLVATDGGLIFCRASITFAIAARWKDITMTRPVAHSGDERVDLAVVWPNHGELTFTVSPRLASNVFRRWLQFQAQNTRRHQVEQAARYERSQRARPEPEPDDGGSDRTMSASATPAPETLQLDQAERDVWKTAVPSSEVTPVTHGATTVVEPGAEPPRTELDLARVVPAGDMAATTHFDDPAAESSPEATPPIVSQETEPDEIDLMHDAEIADVNGSPGDDWRNGWTFSDDHQGVQDHDRCGDAEPADRAAPPSPVRRAVDDDVDRLRRAAADTQIFPDTIDTALKSGRAGGRSRYPLAGVSRRSASASGRVRLGDLATTHDADPGSDRRRAGDRNGVNRSRGGYLDGLPATAGDAALASSGAPDRRTRPDPSFGSSSPPVAVLRSGDGAGPLPVPQISGARLQTLDSSRRRHADGLDIRSVVLTDSEPSLWSEIWHRHRISIMATVSLVALLVIALSSLLARNGDDPGTTVDADIAIPTRQAPAEADPGTGAEATMASTPPVVSDADGSDFEPNSPMIVDAVGGGSETGGADATGRPDSAPTEFDETTQTTTVRICHSNYGGCVPVAPDVDCEGDGDGPAFLSEPVVIFGEDVYELDTDGDREACEPDQPLSGPADG